MISPHIARGGVGRSKVAGAPSGRWRRFVRNRALAVGGGLSAVVIAVALAAPVLAPYDPLTIHANHTLEGPTRMFLLGTDDLGRDNLSQDIYGARLSLIVGLGSVALGTIGGVPWGLAGGFLGGRVGYVLMRLADLVLVFPSLVLALVIRALLGAGLTNVIIALGVTIMPALARVVRGEVLALRERDFVTAAVSVGARNSRILARHIIPNVLDLIVVLGAIYTGGAILTEASLSFLGFGTPPPAPGWGRILQEGYSYLAITPWPSLTAGVAIFLAVLGFYLVGEGARRIVQRDRA
ncbi:MAG TPA: ABC transporter permease [bacterium]|nr:ABC transporter permease [bacterium]